jgi:methyl-accepting chemotaxis protein
VKALANKAHEASGQINQLVSDIDSGAAEAESVIGQVSRAMGELAAAAEKMRTVISDQSNVATLIEQSAVDSAAGADQIAHRISEVAKAAGEAVKLSDEVQASAEGLTRIAHGLRSATDEFLSQLRAA